MHAVRIMSMMGSSFGFSSRVFIRGNMLSTLMLISPLTVTSSNAVLIAVQCKERQIYVYIKSMADPFYMYFIFLESEKWVKSFKKGKNEQIDALDFRFYLPPPPFFLWGFRIWLHWVRVTCIDQFLVCRKHVHVVLRRFYMKLLKRQELDISLW